MSFTHRIHTQSVSAQLSFAHQAPGFLSLTNSMHYHHLLSKSSLKMCKRPECHLLRLRREIRNMINENITIDCKINAAFAETSVAEDSNDPSHLRTKVTLQCTTEFAALPLCRQIHDKYVEHTRPRSRLVSNIPPRRDSELTGR